MKKHFDHNDSEHTDTHTQYGDGWIMVAHILAHKNTLSHRHAHESRLINEMQSIWQSNGKRLGKVTNVQDNHDSFLL